jgi:hypothetical protein
MPVGGCPCPKKNSFRPALWERLKLDVTMRRSECSPQTHLAMCDVLTSNLFASCLNDLVNVCIEDARRFSESLAR